MDGLTESEIKDVMEARRLLHQSHADFGRALALLEGDEGQSMASHFYGEGTKAAKPVNLKGAVNLLRVSARNLSQALDLLGAGEGYGYPYPKPTEGSKGDPQLSIATHFFGPTRRARR